MIWKKDKLRPTQPYFVLETEDFFQEIYLQQGISHFYTFRIEASKMIHAVPDACIDLLFEYGQDGMKGLACGTVLKYTEILWEGPKEFFGVRFMPGYHSALVNVELKELIGKRLPLQEYLAESKILSRLEQQNDFYQRIRVFLDEYTKAENKREKPYGKKELVLAVKDLAYQTDGKIRIHEMQEKTGYSERYINKVFIEEMGFSPKTFCKMIQFQRSLEFLNYGAPDKMTDAAVELGYYDQPQFIRDFKAYAGITPKKYLQLIQNTEYQKRVHNTKFL